MFDDSSLFLSICFFFFNDTATTEIYTLSLHDALPICPLQLEHAREGGPPCLSPEVEEFKLLDQIELGRVVHDHQRSEEHTSELQSRQYLVCRLLLEKKKKARYTDHVQ